MMAADARGNVWYGGLTFDLPGSTPERIVVNRFAPGSTSLQSQTTGLPSRTSNQDKPMMTVDNEPTSPTFGVCTWCGTSRRAAAIDLVISQCDSRPIPRANASWCDNADNWTTPASVTPTSGTYIYGDVAVGPDGRVYVTWWDFSNANAIRGDVCDPASQTARTPRVGDAVDDRHARFDRGGRCPSPARSWPSPAAALRPRPASTSITPGAPRTDACTWPGGTCARAAAPPAAPTASRRPRRT